MNKIVSACFQTECLCPQVAMKYTKKYGAQKVRVLTLVKNRGKGGAVRMVTIQSYPCALSTFLMKSDERHNKDAVCTQLGM